MSKYGIDVSENQGTIDWGQVKADGVSFAILRSVKKNLSTDKQFEANYRGCRGNGIPVGIYKYSYALTEEEAKKEAEAVLRTDPELCRPEHAALRALVSGEGETAVVG